MLVEIAGQAQSDALVAGLAARCASCVAVLDPAASAGALGLVADIGTHQPSYSSRVGSGCNPRLQATQLGPFPSRAAVFTPFA